MDEIAELTNRNTVGNKDKNIVDVVKGKLVVSACLAGLCTKYNGGHNEDPRIKRLVETGQAVVVCPESAAGLPIPRVASEIVGGDGEDVLAGRAQVYAKDGRDLTGEFIEGAEKTLSVVQKVGAKAVILKERSPSCGVNMIYDGTFNGSRRSGLGVAAALLKRQGYAIYSEEDCAELLTRLEG